MFFPCRGAKISIADADGNTAFSIANEYENKEILDILRRERLFARLASSGSRSHRSPRKTSPFDDECHHSKCVICYDRPAEVIFAPCGHRVVCRRDCKKIFELPEEKRCCPLDKEKVHCITVESIYIRLFHYLHYSFFSSMPCRLKALSSRFTSSLLSACNRGSLVTLATNFIDIVGSTLDSKCSNCQCKFIRARIAQHFRIYIP